MHLEYIILNERSQTQKDKRSMVSLTGDTWSNQIHTNRDTVVLPTGWGVGGWGVGFNGNRASDWSDEKHSGDR